MAQESPETTSARQSISKPFSDDGSVTMLKRIFPRRVPDPVGKWYVPIHDRIFMLLPHAVDSLPAQFYDVLH